MAAEPPKQRPKATSPSKRRFPRPFGRYILEKTLSRGGMGEVFLAIVKHLEQHCVIKTIRGDLTGEDEFVGRFADEAKILVRAAHPNIIRYFDAGRVANDYYIAMEFVHGRDLGDVLDRAYERSEPMPPELGLYIATNLLKGLHYAHELQDERGRHMGLVHRDISPQNVLIGFDGSVKLIDFGLARTDLLPNRTQGALAVGKYGYMSPEQARHEPLDGRADVYSAGVMLFEVFTGDRLVDEQDQATLWQRVLNPKHRNPRSVVGTLSAEIDHLVMRAVAVDPKDRFPSALAMAEYAEGLRSGGSNREALKAYLRYLYPRVRFEPPAIPPLNDLAEGVNQSVIFATSREGARSVFGRGELPIEGTMQVDVRDVRSEIERRRRLDPKSAERRSALYPGGISGRLGLGTHQTGKPRTAGEHPTQIASFPTTRPAADATLDDDTTAFMTAPSGILDAADETHRETPVVPEGLAAGYHRDEEDTIMMSAPPQAVLQVSGPLPDPRSDGGASETARGKPLPLDGPPVPHARAPLPEGIKPGRREIHERVRAPQPFRPNEHEALGSLEDAAETRGIFRDDDATRAQPGPIPESVLPASPREEGTSVYLLIGLIFGAAALVVTAFLFWSGGGH